LPLAESDDLIQRAIKTHFGSAQVIEAACQAIVQLTHSTTGMKETLSKRYLPLVFGGMKRHPTIQPLQECAVNLLALLSISPVGKGMVATEGLDLLLAAMKNHPSSKEIHDKACGCLCNLARKDPQNIALMKSKGVVEVLQVVLKNFDQVMNVKHNAKAALANLEEPKKK